MPQAIAVSLLRCHPPVGNHSIASKQRQRRDTKEDPQEEFLRNAMILLAIEGKMQMSMAKKCKMNFVHWQDLQRVLLKCVAWPESNAGEGNHGMVHKRQRPCQASLGQQATTWPLEHIAC